MTVSVGLIRAPVAVVADAYLAWQRPILERYGIAPLRERSVMGSLRETLEALKPLHTPPTRFLFVPTRSPWTAFFDNSVQGSDATGPMSVLAGRLRVPAVRADCAPNTLPRRPSRAASGQFGATIFDYFDASGRSQRAIWAANDGGKWTFGTTGEPFPFEDMSVYSAKRIADRFPPALLRSYLEQLGIHAFEASWFMPVGELAVLVEKEDDRHRDRHHG